MRNSPLHCQVAAYGLLISVASILLTSGCAKPVPAIQPPAPVVEPDGILVTGRVVSTAWAQKGGGIERAIVIAWKLPENERVQEAYGTGEAFEIRLPPGQYRIDFSANGTRGATFQGDSREIAVTDDQAPLDLGEVDLPIGKTTSLYGQETPELAGIIGWQNTEPLSLKDLRGHVVVLDFFAYYCSICHEHKPDLVKLKDRYEREGLIVLAIHDSSLPTLDEMNAKLDPVLRRVFGGEPPHIPMALDGPGETSVFEAYGIYAVPAVILIDQDGRVVRRYHHAGVPELEADVRSLLGDRSGVIF